MDQSDLAAITREFVDGRRRQERIARLRFVLGERAVYVKDVDLGVVLCSVWRTHSGYGYSAGFDSLTEGYGFRVAYDAARQAEWLLGTAD